MKKTSRVTHQPEVDLPDGNVSVVAPVYRSVKFTYPTIQDSLSPESQAHGFDYTRDSNPTTRQLELLAAELQDRDDAIAVATGMASIWLTLLAHLTSGDRIVFFVESYRPARVAIRKFLPHYGIEHSMLSIHDKEGIEAELARDDTKLVLFEAPTNPMLQVPDLEALVSAARRNNVVTVLDNTFAGLHNHGQFDIDYYVHSLTKYASGHGDTMGGIVIGSKQKIRALRPLAVNMGSTLDPGGAFMILRGLKTYYLRYRKHCENAQAVAEFLAGRPEIEHVIYPGLESDSNHQLAKRQMADFGGVVVLELRATKEQSWAFIDALEIFATTASLGSTDSLVAPVKLYLGRDLSEDELLASRITESTVRLAVGIEDADDLIADLSQALNKALQ